MDHFLHLPRRGAVAVRERSSRRATFRSRRWELVRQVSLPILTVLSIRVDHLEGITTSMVRLGRLLSGRRAMS